MGARNRIVAFPISAEGASPLCRILLLPDLFLKAPSFSLRYDRRKLTFWRTSEVTAPARSQLEFESRPIASSASAPRLLHVHGDRALGGGAAYLHLHWHAAAGGARGHHRIDLIQALQRSGRRSGVGYGGILASDGHGGTCGDRLSSGPERADTTWHIASLHNLTVPSKTR